MSEKKFNVEGMGCMSCVEKIQGALKDIGIEGTVDLEGKSLTANIEETQAQSVIDAVTKKGFDITPA